MKVKDFLGENEYEKTNFSLFIGNFPFNGRKKLFLYFFCKKLCIDIFHKPVVLVFLQGEWDFMENILPLPVSRSIP